MLVPSIAVGRRPAFMSRFIGIDFSGAARPWRPLISRPTVWLAIAEDNSDGLRLAKLIPVQSLAGDGQPFDRLVALLAAGDFEAAAIDAPFSLPLAHLPKGGHVELLQQVRGLPNGPDRPFPLGSTIVALGEAVAPRVQAKPLRETEAYWVAEGVNTRSTMWNGPRGGAPFTAACLRLLERSERPSWPWAAMQSGILSEAFPARTFVVDRGVGAVCNELKLDCRRKDVGYRRHHRGFRRRPGRLQPGRQRGINI